MHSSNSIAQILPLHIVESIIDYTGVTESIDNRFKYQELLALLHSCQSWRSVFLRKVCKTIYFITYTSRFHNFGFRFYPDNFVPLTHATSQHVRSLAVCSSGWRYIIDGSLLKWMLNNNVSNVTFLSAKNLEIYVDDLNYISTLSEESTIDAIQNIIAFLHQIQSMVPNIKSVEIIWHNTNFLRIGQNLEVFITDCVINIIRGLRSFWYPRNKSPNRLTQPVPGSFSGLTHFEFDYNDYSVWCAELVRYNARTLESLKTCYLYKSDFTSLLYCNNSDPVIYPFLKVLKLDHINILNDEAEVPDVIFIGNIDGIDHFPILESFYISGDFPFVENVFAPGKNLTLKHLSIIFDDDMLTENNNFFQKYMPYLFYNLSSITVSADNQTTPFDVDFYTHQIEFLQSCLICSTSVTKFDYIWVMENCRFFQEAQSTSIFQSLHFLNIQKTVLSFSDIVMLLQSAIFLQHLECGINKKAPTIKGIEPSKLPNYISSMHPLNKLIAIIKLNANPRTPVKYIAKTAVLLSIGCPRLTSFSCVEVSNSELCKEIDNISKTKWFSDYTEQCQFILSRILCE